MEDHGESLSSLISRLPLMHAATTRRMTTLNDTL